MAKSNNPATILAITLMVAATLSAAEEEATHHHQNSQQQHYGSTVMTAGGFGNGMSFQQCYVGCFILCAILPTETLSSCGFQCFRDCLLPPPNRSHQTATITAAGGVSDNTKNVINIPKTDSLLYFCNLGCASTQCSNISSLDNPRGKEVTGCVRTCAGVCGKNYHSSMNFHTPPDREEDKTPTAATP